MPPRNTYRYKLKYKGKTVFYGFTIDLQRREQEHQRRWPGSRVEQVGEPTTHQEAWHWEKEAPSAMRGG